jgi:hypothetical protein
MIYAYEVFDELSTRANTFSLLTVQAASSSRGQCELALTRDVGSAMAWAKMVPNGAHKYDKLGWSSGNDIFLEKMFMQVRSLCFTIGSVLQIFFSRLSQP